MTFAWHHPSYYRRLRKLQASSSKHQAPSTKRLDKSSGIGYSRTITDGNARLAQPNAGPSRIPGTSGRQTHSKTDVSLLQEQSGRRHLPGIKISRNKNLKHQAPKDLRRIYEAESKAKLQASSPKHKGSSTKPQAASSLIRDP